MVSRCCSILAELLRHCKKETRPEPLQLLSHYELLEATTDRCEDVADVIQNVSVKNN